MSELHQKAEEFVLCALADDTYGDSDQSNEVGLFLLQLILRHKKGQLRAARWMSWVLKQCQLLFQVIAIVRR